MKQELDIEHIVYQYMNEGLSIENIWEQYGEDIIERSQEEKDIKKIVGMIFLTKEMAYRLFEKGFLKSSLNMYYNAISLCVDHDIYNELFENCLFSLANIEFQIESYKLAFKHYRVLIKFSGKKDDYLIGSVNSLRGLINRYSTPVYITVILLWAFELLDTLVLNFYIIPRWINAAGWILWMVALFCQFVIPEVYKRIITHPKKGNSVI